MTNRISQDAQEIRKQIREAEAVTDEAMMACAQLKRIILRARQNPDVAVDAAQRVLIRLQEAEKQALSMSTNLLRAHDELNKVSRVYAGPDDSGTETPLTADLENLEPTAAPEAA